jgi:hypothetical protein
MARSYRDWRAAPARAWLSIPAMAGTALRAGGGTAQGLKRVQGRMGRGMNPLLAESGLMESGTACGRSDWFALAMA